MSTQPIELSAMAVMILCDRIQNTDKDDGIDVAKPLLLKLGSAYCEMVLPDKPKAGTVTIEITEREAWLIRSRVNSGDRVDSEPKMGVTILRQVYAALLAFDADLSLPDTDGAYRTLAEAKQQQTWIPPEFGMGRAKTIGDTADDFGWEQRGV